MDKKYNIYTIAEELGLAPSTVSKAINNKGKISEKTRKRVKDFIQEKGYTPSILASSLKNKVSLSIGVAFPETTRNVMSHSFFSKVIEYFRDAIEKEGYEFSYVSNRLGKYKVTFEEYSRQRSLDGVLILGATYGDENMINIKKSGAKVISIDKISEDIPFVQTSDTLAVNLVKDFFIRKNITKVGYVSGPYNSGEFKKRTSTFQEALNGSGIVLEDAAIEVCKNTYYEDGFSAAQVLLKRKPNIKAILVSNDDMSFGVIRGAQKMGYKVPEDISIVGYDDMFFSKYFTPSLTTIKQNTKVIGKTAGELLIKLIKGDNVPKETYIPCELVERESTI